MGKSETGAIHAILMAEVMKARDQLSGQSDKVRETIKGQVIKDLGLTGVFTRLKRVTGNDYPLIYEDDSEVGIEVAVRFEKTGIPDKMRRLANLLEEYTIKADMSDSADEAISYMDEMKAKIKELF